MSSLAKLRAELSRAYWIVPPSMPETRAALREVEEVIGSLAPEEQFTEDQIHSVIRAWLEYGENSFGRCQQGYFSGDGFGARCLRYHLKQLEAK
jgi:hypothetical protein